MDPNKVLEELRQLVEDEELDGDWSAEEANRRLVLFVHSVEALDTWLSRGGFLPDAWQR